MKYVGFIKRHSKFISCAKENPETLRSTPSIPQDIKKVIAYLEKGVTLMAMLHWQHDVDGEAIGPAIIQTDGVWIWPSYYTFYLKKYETIPPTALVDYINSDNREAIILNRVEQLYANYCLALLLKIDNTKMIIPNELQIIIDPKPITIECY